MASPETTNDFWGSLLSVAENGAQTYVEGSLNQYFTSQQNAATLQTLQQQAAIKQSLLNSTNPPDSVGAQAQNGQDFITKLFSQPQNSVGGTRPTVDAGFSVTSPLVLVGGAVVILLGIFLFRRG